MRASSLGIESPTGRGPSRRRAALIGPGSRPGRVRATTMPSGNGVAVVKMDWPVGSSATRARLRAGSSSENTSSRSSVGTRGVLARTSSCTPRRSARARQRCSPCEAWVRASRPSIWSNEVVTVGPHRVDAPPQVVRPAGDQRVEQVSLPAPGVLLADQDPIARSGQAGVDGADRLRPGRPPAARAPPRAPCRRRPAAGPTRRGWSRRPRCCALPTGATRRPAGAGRGRSRPRRGSLGVEHAQRVVEEVTTAAGSPADDGQVLGAEDRAGRGDGQFLPAGHELAVHPGTAPPRRPDLGLDQGGAVGRVDVGPNDGARRPGPHQRLGWGAPEGAPGPQIGERFEHARLARAVGPRDDRGSLGLGIDLRGVEETKVGQLEVPDAHRDR